MCVNCSDQQSASASQNQLTLSVATLKGPVLLIMLLNTNNATEIYIENGLMDGVTGKTYTCELQVPANISDSALNA